MTLMRLIRVFSQRIAVHLYIIGIGLNHLISKAGSDILFLMVSRNSMLMCLFLLFSLSTLAAEGDIYTEVDGMGSSLQAALTDAKRNAVEKCIGSLLVSQTEIENFTLKKDFILVKTVGAIRKVEVLSETKNSDGSYFVRIRAIVSTSSIKEDLVAMQILLESMNKPRLMVLIDESGQPTVQNNLVSFMTDKGFDIIDSSAVEARNAFVGNDKKAAELGKLSGAEYIITGRASKDTGVGAFGMTSGQVALSVSIINCSTGRILTSKSDTASFAHVDGNMAVAEASKRVASSLFNDAIFEKLIVSFQDMVNNGMPLELMVENVKNFRLKKKVTGLIETLPDVVSVKQQGFRKGTVSYTVVYKGVADGLCENLDGKIIDSGGVFSVTDIIGSRVVASLQ